MDAHDRHICIPDDNAPFDIPIRIVFHNYASRSACSTHGHRSASLRHTLKPAISWNLDRHMEEHHRLFQHLVAGDRDSAQKHREFYDEYLAVMDLCAEFYLQTCDTVFVRHALPNVEMTHRRQPVDPAQIRRVALMTVEGEHDDISGVGQTQAAHKLCTNIPASRKTHWPQPGVGHYGVFNGSRFRSEIVPRVTDFILANDGSRSQSGASS